MNVVIRRGDAALRTAATVAVGVYENSRRLEGAAVALDRASGGALSALISSRDFRGGWLETAIVHPNRGRARRLIAIGLGRRGDDTPHRARLAAAIAARRARELRAGSVALVLPWPESASQDQARAEAMAEGARLGPWRHTAYLREPGPPALRRFEIVARDAESARALAPAVTLGARTGEAVCFARDLSSTPGQDLTPEGLATRAREVGKAAGAKVEVLGVAQLERLGMGALLAVGRGSANPPRFIVLDRAPTRALRRGKPVTLVVIGKGVTFDSGGISLKPHENMHKMKYDMSGAAAVLGLFHALPALDPTSRVVGLIPSAENMPGSRALKPGDIVRALDGTSIEVTNTDAEGRLLLADALGYARRLKPDAVVDLATLTGSIGIALGHLAAGLFTDDERLADELARASSATGERLWRMPLWDEYAPEMKSESADLLNSGAREGGACLAAVFLKHFARGMRWAHLDIASTAWSPVDRAHERRGPTGFGVRLLLEWIARREAN
ncbi:MAG: leucyl aminopeptidase [Candidatus Eisenbacteria bacterium]|nr:leucyl aminopeptidase [Candidatus Eisenbacteria bacterium]